MSALFIQAKKFIAKELFFACFFKPRAPMLSSCLLIRICPKDIGLFRFLLEAYEHVGYFSVLERHTALLKVVFSPDMEEQVRKTLGEIAQSLALTLEEYPFADRK